VARAQGPVEQIIRQRVAEHPDATWLKWQDAEVAWRDVLSNARRAANGLLELGVRPGERVAILMGNRPEFLWAHLGIVFIGASSVPVNISQRGPTLQHILRDSGAAAVIVQNDLRDALATVAAELPGLRHTVVFGGPAGDGADWDFDRLMSAPDTEPEVELAEPGGSVGMMYTSGTTGPPKGVVANRYDTTPLQVLLRASGVQPGETMYTPLPLFHGNALLVSAIGSMVLDAKLALAPRFSASRFWDDCRRYEAVEFNTLGGMISILLKQPPGPGDTDHRVRVVLSAGCPPDRWEEFQRRFGVRIIEWFGMVDSPGILSTTRAGSARWAGRAWPGSSSRWWATTTAPWGRSMWGSSRSAIRPGRRPTTRTSPTRRSRPTAAAGSIPATWPNTTRTAFSTTAGGRRSPFAGWARTSPRGRWRRSSTPTRRCWKAPRTP
jgi:crotonobetaine/carnitine-CoA ligase